MSCKHENGIVFDAAKQTNVCATCGMTVREMTQEQIVAPVVDKAVEIINKDRLERIATAAMQGELASQDAEQGWPMESHDKLAAVCVSAARALIAELDKEGQS